MAELGINFIPGFKNPYQKGTESSLDEKAMWIEDNLFGLLQNHLTSSVPDAFDWVADKLAEKKFKKALRLKHAANVAKGPWLGGKIGPSWFKYGTPGLPIPKGPLAKAGSKILGPLQFMTPGKAMAPDLTEEEKIKHPLIPFGPFERGR